MPRSIKLIDNTYWDMTAIRNGIERVLFTIPANGSKTLSFTTNSTVLLFTAKTTRGDGNNCSLIFAYGAGTSDRYKISQLYTGSGHISFTINGQTIKISNSVGDSYTCSILFLIGTHGNVTIS